MAIAPARTQGSMAGGTMAVQGAARAALRDQSPERRQLGDLLPGCRITRSLMAMRMPRRPRRSWLASTVRGDRFKMRARLSRRARRRPWHWPWYIGGWLPLHRMRRPAVSVFPTNPDRMMENFSQIFLTRLSANIAEKPCIYADSLRFFAFFATTLLAVC
jgi:hypothetical protein